MFHIIVELRAKKWVINLCSIEFSCSTAKEMLKKPLKGSRRKRKKKWRRIIEFSYSTVREMLLEPLETRRNLILHSIELCCSMVGKTLKASKKKMNGSRYVFNKKDEYYHCQKGIILCLFYYLQWGNQSWGICCVVCQLVRYQTSVARNEFIHFQYTEVPRKYMHFTF